MSSAEKQDPPRLGSDGEIVAYDELKQHQIRHNEVLVNKELMNDAYAGENAQHEMGLWAAVKAHPMACIWAFIFCFTIVRQLLISNVMNVY